MFFLLPRVFCVALDKELFAECPKKHSAKYLVLGKEPNSGSSYSNCASIVIVLQWSFLFPSSILVGTQQDLLPPCSLLPASCLMGLAMLWRPRVGFLEEASSKKEQLSGAREGPKAATSAATRTGLGKILHYTYKRDTDAPIRDTENLREESGNCWIDIFCFQL